jgi:hypothetical protein
MEAEVEALRRLAVEAAAEVKHDRTTTCLPFLHRWARWEMVSDLSIYQRRRCARCGLTQKRTTG